MNANLGKAYFRDQLRRDPLVDCDTILAIRAAALGIEARPASNRRRLRSLEIVDQTQASMLAIRSEFWTLPADELTSLLDAIDVDVFPELATALERMKTAAQARDDFQRLSLRLKKNVAMINYLRQSITANPRDIGGLKEIVARDLQGPNAKKCKRAARLIKQEFPRVHAVDPAWIDQMIESRVPGASRFVPPFIAGVPFWVWGVIAFSLIRVFMAMNNR